MKSILSIFNLVSLALVLIAVPFYFRYGITVFKKYKNDERANELQNQAYFMTLILVRMFLLFPIFAIVLLPLLKVKLAVEMSFSLSILSSGALFLLLLSIIFEVAFFKVLDKKL